MDPTLISIVIGAAVVGVILCIGLVLVPSPSREAEDRLAGLTSQRRPAEDPSKTILLRPQTAEEGGLKTLMDLLPRGEGFTRLYDQADVDIPFGKFLLIPLGLAVVSVAAGFVLEMPPALIGSASAAMAALPFAWLWARKRKRIKQFTAAMPEALELIGRALRAGHGLASGLHVVAEEMGGPISEEFGRVYEEQNLGIPIDEALRGLTRRVPTMDVRFLVTAIVVQRATGGDLAEILDKIGRLIRERFQILGQVQALTAEGRLSGIVLLALPPALLAFTYTTNPDYVALLFNTPMGTKMLVGAGVMQLVGAVAIKKIITIKV